jgi:hypothetical protein
MALGDQDQDHLKLLSIFHYVVGGIAVLFACFPLIHVTLGLMMVFSPESFDPKSHEPPPAALGWIFVAIGGFLSLLGWAYAILIIFGGRFLAQRKHYTACIVIGALACLFMPFGTILGVFTLIVLMKPQVKLLFEPSGPPAPKNPPPH